MGATGNLVQWDESYAIGLEAIDSQHKMLFDCMNHLWSAIVRRADAAEMADILKELEYYTVTHFTAEEAFMQSVGYVGVEGHKKQHKGFVEKIAAAREASLRGEQVSLELLNFLKDWLVKHIQAEDRGYARHFGGATQHKSFLGRFFGRFARH